jgi:hypothetical protein
MTQTSGAKKRNYASPQKTQTSIVTFYNDNKKQNNSTTPPRTAIARSYQAITASKTPMTSPPKNSILSNNPYRLLAEAEEESNLEATTTVSQDTAEVMNQSANRQDNTKQNEVLQDSGADTDTTSVSSGISSPEKKLLSRQAQQALHKIRRARKILEDDSVRAELKAALADDYSDLPQDPQPRTEDDSDEPLADVDMAQADDNGATTISPTISPSNQKTVKPAEKEVEPSFSSKENSKQTQKMRMENASIPNNTRNVSFAKAALRIDSNALRKGNLQAPDHKKVTLGNPPLKSAEKEKEQGMLFANRSKQNPVRVDKIISLKRDNTREYTHRYTLRFKTIQAKTDEEGHQLVQDTLQRFLEIVLQADPKTIVPPYLELNRSDKAVSDLSLAFPV